MMMKQQIIDLFTNPQQTMMDGLWFSGHRGEGEYNVWYMNGQLQMHYFYKDGLKEGEYKEWYSNGQLAAHYLYKGGKIIRNLK